MLKIKNMREYIFTKLGLMLQSFEAPGNILKKTEAIERLVAARLDEKHIESRPLNIGSVLWNAETEPFTGEERRWQLIDKATTVFRMRREIITINTTTAICRVLGRYWIRCNPDGGIVPSRLITEGCWELFITEVIAHSIKPGMIVIDAGANIGYYSTIMADLVGQNGKIYVCEPCPTLRENLKKTFQLNWLDDSRTSLIFDPLYSEKNVDIKLVAPEDVNNSYVILQPDLSEINRIYSMKTTTLDDVVQGESKIDIVRLDTNGSEYNIWLGMKNIIARSPCIKIFLRFNTRIQNHDIIFLELIEDSGFSINFIDPFKGPRPTSVEEILNEMTDRDLLLYLVKPT